MKNQILTLAFLTFLFFLPLKNLKAQIIYVDIPDTTLFIPNVQNVDTTVSFYLDINNDNIDDFDYSAFRSYYFHQGNLFSGQGICIDTASCLGCKVAGACYFSTNNIINYLDTISYHAINWSNIVAYYRLFQNNFPFFCDIVGQNLFNGFLLKVGNDTLYGWIRCDATSNSITIKDYAYNSVPNGYILAGQISTEVPTNTIEDNFTILLQNNVLQIIFAENISVTGYVQITNSSGIQVSEILLQNQTTNINVSNYLSGIYFIKVITSQGIITKKVVL